MGGISYKQYVQYKADAIKRIYDFKRRHALQPTNPNNPVNQHVPGFPRLCARNIGEELEKRVNDPESIDQGVSSLCGPASIIFCWLRKRPDLYVQYVINVCETGTGKIGDLSVSPKTDCKNYWNWKRKSARDPITDKRYYYWIQTISAVDWIALAALKDSENSPYDYQSADNELRGITLPSTMEKWFKNIGYFVTSNETNLLFPKKFNILREAAAHHASRESVCLFVNANFISETKGKNRSADHWVVMMSEPKIDGQSIFSFPDAAGLDNKAIDFNIFTWGKISRIKNLNKQTVTVKEFLSCFRGFVSAEYPHSSAFEFKLLGF